MNINDYFSFDIKPHTSTMNYQAGDTIIQEDTNVNRLIFVEQGTVKVLETQENGVVSLIRYLIAPCFLGELEVFNEGKWTSGNVAVTDCKCTVIHLDQCRSLIQNDIRFLQYLCQYLSEKIVANSRFITRSNSYPLKNRLATFIQDTQNKGLYTIPHTEASSYLGVTYRHFLYVLAELVDEGMIEKTKSGYRITDPVALNDLYINVTK